MRVENSGMRQPQGNPNVAKVGGLQSQGVKGEIVVGYLDPLTTQDLKSSGFPVMLGRSCKRSLKGKQHGKIDSILLVPS